MPQNEARLREFAGLLSARIDELRERKPASDASLKKAFRAVADTIPTIIWTATREGEVTYFNRRFHETFGSDCDWTKLVHPEDRQALADAWAHSVATGEPYTYAARIMDSSGTYRYLLTSAHAALDDEGNVAYWIGSSMEYKAQAVAVRQVA